MSPQQPTKTSKQGRILSYLETGKSISRNEAVYLFQLANVPDVIMRLRNRGYDIVTFIKTDANGNRYARYSLEEA